MRPSAAPPFVDGYNPSQPRGPDGRWTSTGSRLDALFKLTGHNAVEHVEFASIRRPAELSKLVGVNVRGFKHAASNQAFSHTLSKHGNASSERSRGQKAITRSDFALLPMIAKTGRYQEATQRPFGPKRVQIVAEVGGDRYFYVGEVRRAKKRIDMVTMWKK